MKQSRYVLHGVVLQCDGCRQLLYVLFVTQVSMAFVAQISAQEATELYARGASPREVLQHLGVLARAA